jgi:hypothetical protein
VLLAGDDGAVWRARPEPILDRETVNGIIEMLMELDAKLELLVDHFGLRADEEDENDDTG